MQYTMITGKQSLLDENGRVIALFVSARESLQNLLVCHALHIDQHHDVTALADLIDNMPDGVNKAAVSDWIKRYVKCDVDTIPGQKEKRVRYNEGKMVDFDSAKATHWWTLKKQAMFEGFDLAEKLEAVLQEANKKLKLRTKLVQENKLDEAEKIVVNLDQIRKVRAILAITKAEAANNDSVIDDAQTEATVG